MSIRDAAVQEHLLPWRVEPHAHLDCWVVLDANRWEIARCVSQVLADMLVEASTWDAEAAADAELHRLMGIVKVRP